MHKNGVVTAASWRGFSSTGCTY